MKEKKNVPRGSNLERQQALEVAVLDRNNLTQLGVV